MGVRWAWVVVGKGSAENGRVLRMLVCSDIGLLWGGEVRRMKESKEDVGLQR